MHPAEKLTTVMQACQKLHSSSIVQGDRPIRKRQGFNTVFVRQKKNKNIPDT